MRSKKFDVIAVDELDTMYLEADFTDAIVSADAASKKCSRAFSGLLCDDGSTADISEAGGCDNDEEDFTDDTSITGLIDNAFEFANKNATRSTCPLQLPWGKGCRTIGSSIPSRKGAVDARGSRRRHETVAHFGHPRIGRPGFETCAHLGDTMLGKLTLAMRPRAPRHTKRARHGFGAIEARVLERRGREVAEAIPRDRDDGAHSLSVSPFYFLYHARRLRCRV